MRAKIGLGVLMLAVGLATAVPAWSQAAVASSNPLDQLAWMTGGTWTADGDKGPDGKPFHVEMSCHWGKNHRVLEFTTWFMVGGKLTPVYEGIYAWHPAKKKFVFYYTNDDGELTEGEAAMTGDHLEQEFQIVGVDGAAHAFRSTIVRRGQDDYDWNVQNQKDGAWVVLFGLKYKRRPA